MASNTEPRQGYRLGGTFNPVPFSEEHFSEMEELLSCDPIADHIKAELQEEAIEYDINKKFDNPIRPTESRAVCEPIINKGAAIADILQDIDDVTKEKLGFAVDLDIAEISATINRCHYDLTTLINAADKVIEGLPKGKSGNPQQRRALGAFVIGYKNPDDLVARRGLKSIFEDLTGRKATVSYDSNYSYQASLFVQWVALCLNCLSEQDMPQLVTLTKHIQKAIKTIK